MYRKMMIVVTVVLTFILVSCSDGSKENEYAVIFDTDGGTLISNKTVTENETLVLPDAPTKADYNFIGWTLNDELFDPLMLISESITLKALWEWKYFDNPVWQPILADPTIIRHEGIYYAYGTQDDGVWGTEFGLKYIPIIESSDLINWSYAGSVFTGATRPFWGTLNAGLWAPDIVKVGDKFMLYYSLSSWGDPNPGIGVASADHPKGPWTDHGKLFTSSEIGVNNSIDANVFYGQDGKLYMVWGSFRGIYGIELSEDGLSIKGGLTAGAANKVHLAGTPTDERFSTATYEGAFITYRNGYYYMYVSHGTCCNGLNSTYNVRVGRSTSPLGSYVDHLGRTMKQANVGYQVVAPNAFFVGVGHNAIATDDAGDDWLIYHGFDTSQPSHVGNSNRRSMLIDRLIWNEGGWPSVENTIPSDGTSLKPQINK